ncbi:two-component regulator propeller domain-containing protein [Sphingomonas sp.]|uniref:ligand-binding sensor domain-containing protein n=1 Tax=Sphingomonas sp. TaxID=28214 RepID=UPI0031D5131C
MGLPHITTTAIARARDGTMWIGTRGGLTRYDGQRVRVFKQVQVDPHSLPDNYVRALIALPDGGVLVGTNVGGLARYDPQKGYFVRLKAMRGHIGSRIFGFTSDGAGGAYVASDGGVHRYLASSDAIDPMAESAIPSANGQHQGAFAVHRDPDGTLWAGCEQGLWVLRPGAHRFDPVPLAGNRLTGDVWAIMRDRRGQLWVGTGADGIFRSTGGGSQVSFRQDPMLAGNAPLIGHRTIRAILEDRQGRVWIGTDGMGIVLVDPSRPSAVTALRRIPANPFSLAGDTVRSLALDGNGGVWAATELGASRASRRDDAVLRIGSAMTNARLSLSDDNVRGILIDRRGRIWLGLSSGAIDQLDRDAGRVRHLTLNGHHSGQDIKALIDASDGSILVGARGLVAIDPITLAQHDVPIPELGGLPVISLAETGRHLLIGTYKGLYARDKATGRVTLYEHDPANPRSLPNNEVINIVVAGDGQVLVATPGGIGRLDVASGRFANYANRANDPDSLPQDYTASIVSAGRNLWVGTYGGVAFGQSTKSGWRFRAISEAHGLSGDNVASLVLDSRSRVWAASAGGISVIDPAARYVHAMSRRDGLTIRAFNQRAAARMTDGSLLFGSPTGLTVLQPETLLKRQREAEGANLIVSEAHVDGRRLPINSALRNPTLRLGRDGRTLRLGFALTDYDAPEEITYSYRLDGFDREWMEIPAGTPAGATYTNLPAGRYTLQLRAQVPGLAAQTITRPISGAGSRSADHHATDIDRGRPPMV